MSINERSGIVTIQGNPLTLLGPEVGVGAPAPAFTVLDNGLAPFAGLKAGTVYVINVVPSLDTPVCDLQVRAFNKAAADLGDRVEIKAVSMDLPFAQARWCGAAGVDRVQTLSDHRDASFGLAFGLLIKELRLLARAVLVIDGKGVIRYRQIVPEVTSEPDYQAALAAVAAVVREG